MPRLFNDHMIDDAVACIHATDLVPEHAKAGLIGRIRQLRGLHCAVVATCAACERVVRCEERIGAILNGEAEDAAGGGHGLRLAVSNAA